MDTRTRLYYTAKINDNLKFVNKFEFDATWGSGTGSRNSRSASVVSFVDGAGQTNTLVIPTSGNNRSYGEVGADGANIEIKNSYADFTVGPVRTTVGVQAYSLFRDFAISDDASGVITRWQVLDNFVLAGSWLKNYEGGRGTGNNEDLDTWTLTGAIFFSETMSLKPSISYANSAQVPTAFGTALLGSAGGAGTISAGAPFGSADVFTYGADFDWSGDSWGMWATAFAQTGSVEATNLLGVSGEDQDFKGWLAAVGGNVMLGMFDIHGQIIYSPGDDDPLDDEIKNVFTPSGSYYWSEIMGLGIFDDAASAGAPGDKIFNLRAFNIGTSVKPMDKLKVTADLWYAQRDEDLLFIDPLTGLPFGEKKLGTELDLVVTYQLVEGLNLDLVGAYLWADDATSLFGKNDEDPYEVGMRLSLSF